MQTKDIKRLKINFEFEKYIAEIAILSIAKLLQSSEFRRIDYLLKQVDIAMFHMMKEYVSIAI